MSFQTIYKLVSTITFKATIKLTLVVMVVIATIAALSAWYSLYQADNELKHEISEFKEEITSIYDEGGLVALQEEFEIEELEIWSKEDTDNRIHDDEILYVLTAKSLGMIAGTKSLIQQDKTWYWQDYALEEESTSILSHKFNLDNRYELVLSRAKHHEHYEIKQNLASGLFWLVLISPILAIVIGFTLSRTVVKHMQEMSEELKKVSKSSHALRLNVNSDFFEFNQVRLAINAMLDEMAVLHRDIETMSVGIAHDLKTPLSRVANRLQLMQQDIADKTMTELHLERANEQLTVVLSTFTNIVRLSEIESGKRKQQFKSLNLSQLISEMADNYEPLFSDTGRVLDISVVDNVFCMGDPDLLNQMLNNLLENALDYSEESATVWVRLQHHTSGVLLQVGDSGPGISDADHDKVFSRFYRADISRNKPGNGLGLSIVQAVCKLHDAEITLLKNQAGATFNIKIPIN